MRFVSFSGVDGSGKSSQADLLRKKLEQEGRRVASFHAVEFSLANRIARAFRRKRFSPGSERGVTRASSFTVMLRTLFLACDMLRFAGFRKRLEREGYDFLLSDRSFYDSLVHLAYLARKDSPPAWLERLLPRADLAFFFEIQPEKIQERARMPEQGLPYLQAKHKIFQGRLVAWDMIILDAGRSREEISESILRKLSSDPASSL